MKIVPLAAAAAAPATSPPGSMARVNPTGASSTGMATSVPSTVVRSDGETVRPGTAICGTNPTSPNASQFARIVRSASAAPSM